MVMTGCGCEGAQTAAGALTAAGAAIGGAAITCECMRLSFHLLAHNALATSWACRTVCVLFTLKNAETIAQYSGGGPRQSCR